MISTDKIAVADREILHGLRRMLEAMAKLPCEPIIHATGIDCASCQAMDAVNRMGKTAVDAIMEIRRQFPEFYMTFQENQLIIETDYVC